MDKAKLEELAEALGLKPKCGCGTDIPDNWPWAEGRCWDCEQRNFTLDWLQAAEGAARVRAALGLRDMVVVVEQRGKTVYVMVHKGQGLMSHTPMVQAERYSIYSEAPPPEQPFVEGEFNEV